MVTAYCNVLTLPLNLFSMILTDLDNPSEIIFFNYYLAVSHFVSGPGNTELKSIITNVMKGNTPWKCIGGAPN